jgi:hypothetical protein
MCEFATFLAGLTIFPVNGLINFPAMNRYFVEVFRGREFL